MSSSPAMEATFRILELVVERNDGIGFGELLAEVEQSRATLARFLKFMCQNGYLKKINSRYHVGPAFAFLASRVSLSDHVLEIADPIVKDASMEVENTCIYFGWNGLQLHGHFKHLYPSSIVMQEMGQTTTNFSRTPWGWVVLEDYRRRGLDWTEFADFRVLPKDLLAGKLDAITAHGFALDDVCEYEGIRRMAVGVRVCDRLIGCIGMGGMETVLSDSRAKELGSTLLAHAAKIAASFGGAGSGDA